MSVMREKYEAIQKEVSLLDQETQELVREASGLLNAYLRMYGEAGKLAVIMAAMEITLADEGQPSNPVVEIKL